MAAGGNDVEVRFGATIDDFKSKMAEVQGIFGQVAQRWLALTAAVAGGAAFKEFVAHANQVNVEAEKMSRTLGISAEEAGAIIATVGDVGAELGDAGAGAETYTSSFLKFNRMLRSSSDEMKAMGVDVDALKTGQKTSNEVFQEALQIVGKYKPGIDQTQAAMKLFGRSVDDVQLLMKANAERIEETRLKMVALNRTITNEGIASAKAYRGAMNDVGDVLDGFKKTVGEAVMPMLTEMADQLASIGPTLIEATQAAVDTAVQIWQALRDAVVAVWGVIRQVLADFGSAVADAFGDRAIGPMEIFKNALRLVAAAFVAFRIGVETVANVVRTVVEMMKAGFSNFAEVASAALRLDWEGVKAAWRKGQADSARVLQEGIDRAVQIAQKGRADLDKALVSGPAPKTPAGGPDNKGTQTFKIKDPNADAAATAQLALERARTQASLALQLEYLRQYQALYDDAYANNLISARDYFDAKLQLELVATDATIAAKRKELEDVRKLEAKADKPQQKLQFQAQEAALLGQINVLEAKRADSIRANTAEYEKAERARVDALNAIAAARKKAGAESDISADRAAMEQELALRRITAEKAFQIQAELEQRSYRATVEALQAKAAAIHGTEGDAQKQREALYAEAEAAERAHQQRLTEIENAAERERMKYSIAAQQQTQGAFQELVAGMLNGVTKMSDLMRNFAMRVTDTFVNLIAQKFTDKLFDATGANAAIDKMVSFFTEGVADIVRTFIGAEMKKTAVQQTQSGVRMGAQAIEKAAEKGATLAGVAVTEGAELAKTGSVQAGAAIRTTTEGTAAAASKGFSLGSAIANIGAKAWEAAAAVYAAIAAIPVVGPFLAPAAAFAAGAVVLGFVGKIASSEGGEYRVDQDRLNIVHKDETILPAPFAEGLRQLVGKGGVTPVVAAIDQIVETLAPDARQARATTGSDPAPSPATQPVAALASAAPEKSLSGDPGALAMVGEPAAPPGQPVPADASTSLARDLPPAPESRAEPLDVASPARPVPADASAPPIQREADSGQTALPLANPAPAVPVPADAAVSLARGTPPAPEARAEPGPTPAAPRPAEMPVAADASISVALATPPAPEGRAGEEPSVPPGGQRAAAPGERAQPAPAFAAPIPADASVSLARGSAPAPEGKAGEPATQPAAPGVQSPNTPKPMAGAAAVPVPADAATSLVLAPPKQGETALPPAERANEVAAPGKPTQGPQERETAKALAAGELLPTKVTGLKPPEVPQTGTPATTPAQDVGKLVMNWQAEEERRDKPLTESKMAMSRLQDVTAGQSVERPWWRVPRSSISRIQSQATEAAGPGGGAPGNAQGGGPAAAPVQLVGASAGDFFIANRKHLLKVLSDAGRDLRKPQT